MAWEREADVHARCAGADGVGRDEPDHGRDSPRRGADPARGGAGRAARHSLRLPGKSRRHLRPRLRILLPQRRPRRRGGSRDHRRRLGVLRPRQPHLRPRPMGRLRRGRRPAGQDPGPRRGDGAGLGGGLHGGPGHRAGLRDLQGGRRAPLARGHRPAGAAGAAGRADPPLRQRRGRHPRHPLLLPGRAPAVTHGARAAARHRRARARRAHGAGHRPGE